MNSAGSISMFALIGHVLCLHVGLNVNSNAPHRSYAASTRFRMNTSRPPVPPTWYTTLRSTTPNSRKCVARVISGTSIGRDHLKRGGWEARERSVRVDPIPRVCGVRRAVPHGAEAELEWL